MNHDIAISGLAISIIFAFLRWAIPAMPKSVAWAGVAAGFVILLASTTMPQMNITPPVVGLFLAGALCIGGATYLALKPTSIAVPLQTEGPPSQPYSPEPVPSPPQPRQQAAQYGALYGWQTKILSDAVSQYSKIVMARPQMSEPQGFSRLFENAFRTLGIEPIVTQQNPNARNQTGVKIGVMDINKTPSADALRMQEIIRRMGFDGDFIQLRDESLVAAKDNNEFAIYVGPPPLN